MVAIEQNVTMQWKRLKNERTRLILTLELAVVLPAAALVILSALHLRSIQRDRGVEAAIERDFNQVLAISAQQFNQKANELAADARADFPRPSEVCAPSLDRVLAEHPYLAHVFIFDPDHGMIFRSQASRMNEPDFAMEASDLSRMMDGWLKIDGYKEFVEDIEKVNKRGMPYMFEDNSTKRGGKTWLLQPIGLFLEDMSDGRKMIAGVVFDADYIHDKFMPEMLDKVMAHNLAENQQDRN